MKQEQKIILYTTANGNVTVSVRFEDETFWMTQKAIAELFEVGTAAVSKHIKNIYEDEELTPDATVSKMETVQDEDRDYISQFDKEMAKYLRGEER